MRIQVAALSLLNFLPLTTIAQDVAFPGHRGPLAIVTISPAKRSFKVGEPVEVTLLLEARSEGVYVAKTWGKAGGAIPGFFLSLETVNGNPAQTCGSSSDALPLPEPDEGDSLQRHFLFLHQGEIIGWKTAIECPAKRRGKYRITASYSAGQPDTERVVSLAETKGLVLQHIIHAKPIEILIY